MKKRLTARLLQRHKVKVQLNYLNYLLDNLNKYDDILEFLDEELERLKKESKQ